MGEATFVQAAGFLKIADGDNPLDATWIHPESYEVAQKVLGKLGFSTDDLRQKETTAAVSQKISELEGQAEQLASDWQVGLLTLRDIMAQLTRPGRDPREDLPQPIFKRGVLKLDDLQPGMELFGSVLNVVDFGAFVDIGLHDSGLVHVSQLANRFVRDPHDVVSVGDIVKVWVVEIDKTRRRVSLTMIAPGTPRHVPQRSTGGESGESKAPRGRRPPRQRRTEAGGPSGEPSQAQHTTDQSAAPVASAGMGSTPAGSPRGRAGDRQGHPSGKPQQRRQQGRQHHHHQAHSGPKPKPKPLIPITKAMIEGKEPLRTFGDLMQFVQHQTQPPETPAAAAPAQTDVSEHGQPPSERESQPLPEKHSNDAGNGAETAEAANQMVANTAEPHSAAE